MSVLIASRLAPSTRPQANGALLVEAAIQSIRAQTAAARIELRIVIGVDRGTTVPPALADRHDVAIGVRMPRPARRESQGGLARHCGGMRRFCPG